MKKRNLIALAIVCVLMLVLPVIGFAADGDRVLDAGNAPIRAEIIEAKLTITTQTPNLQVWAINAEGNVVGEVPATYADGKLTFTVGKINPACYYLICND